MPLDVFRDRLVPLDVFRGRLVLLVVLRGCLMLLDFPRDRLVPDRHAIAGWRP